MNKIIKVISIFLFSILKSQAQDILITCKDTANIRFRAEMRIRDLEERMNLLTYSSTNKELFDRYFLQATKGQSRLFYKDDIFISNDIDPQNIISNNKNVNQYLKIYLLDLFSKYQKNDDDEPTIFFSNIHCSNLKKTSYYYLNVYFDCEYKSKYTPTGQSYPKFTRLAEMKAELTGKTGSGINEWTVTINAISFANPEDFINDKVHDYLEIARVIDCDPDVRVGEGAVLFEKADQSAHLEFFGEAITYIKLAIKKEPGNNFYRLKLIEYEDALKIQKQTDSISKVWISRADYAFKFRRYQICDSLYSKLLQLDKKYWVPEAEIRKKQIGPIISKTDGLQGLLSRNQLEQVINKCTIYQETDNNSIPEYFYWRAKAYAASNNYKRALSDLNQAIQIDDNYLDAYELRANLKLQNEDRSGALSDYSTLKSKDPKNDYYFISSARAQKEVKDYDKAVRDYESALQINPDNATTYYELGEVEYLVNEYDIAQKNLSRAIEKRKVFPEANYYLGQIAMKDTKSDRYQRAGNYFKLAISQGLSPELKNVVIQKADEFYNGAKDNTNPQNSLAPLNCAIQIYDSKPEYFIARGNAFFKMGDLRKAIADYRASTILENTDFKNFYLLGIAYYENEQLDSAKIAFFKSLDIKENYYPAKIYLGHTYYKEKEYSKAVSYFSEALNFKKDSARIYFYIGNAYSQLHQPQQALDYYAKALDHDGEDPDFNVGRGNVYFDLNEYKQAIKDYNHALGHNPELADALFHRAQCLVRMEDYDPALSDLNKYLQKNSMDAEALRLRGMCLVHKENYPMAIEDFKSAKKIDKAYVSEPLLNKNLAYSYLKLNDPVHALDCSNQILQMDQKNPDALLYKGIALYQQNKTTDAMDAFKEAFLTGSFSKKAIKNNTLLNSLQKNAEFNTICNQYLH